MHLFLYSLMFPYGVVFDDTPSGRAYKDWYKRNVESRYGKFWYLQAAKNNYDQIANARKDDSFSSNATQMPKIRTRIAKRRADKFLRESRMARSLAKWANKTALPKKKAAQQSAVKRSPGFDVFRGGNIKKLRPRNMGASSSKSSGFFKKSSRRKLNTFEKVGARGITVCNELGGVLTGPLMRTGYVGHAIFTRSFLRYNVARAFVKWIARQLKIDIVDFASSFPTEVPTGSAISVALCHRTSWTGTVTETLLSITPGTTTFEQIAQEIYTLASAFTPSGQFTSIRISHGNGTRFVYSMLKSKIDVYVKSTLKIQNRTINASGNLQADDVDNVPLYGKSYYGTGNYIQMNYNDFAPNNAQTDIYLIAPSGTTVSLDPPTIANGETGTVNPFTEPPKKNQLFNVKGVGKAHLDPGQVKTSVLYYRKVFSLNKVFQAASGTDGTSNQLCNIGKYRIFCFEKMLDSVAYDIEGVNAIRIAYEHDHKMAINVSMPQVHVSNTIVRQVLN